MDGETDGLILFDTCGFCEGSVRFIARRRAGYSASRRRSGRRRRALAARPDHEGARNLVLIEGDRVYLRSTVAAHRRPPRLALARRRRAARRPGADSGPGLPPGGLPSPSPGRPLQRLRTAATRTEGPSPGERRGIGPSTPSTSVTVGGRRPHTPAPASRLPPLPYLINSGKASDNASTLGTAVKAM